MKIKTYFLIVLVSLISPLFVRAEGQEIKEFPNVSYVFHLFYDNGKLAADRNAQYKYDLVTEVFTPEAPIARPYTGEIMDSKNKVLGTFKFDPQKGNPSFTKGAVAVKGPYFASAAIVNFLDPQNQLQTSILVSDSAVCNDNKRCDTDAGEDEKTCPGDCIQATATPLVSVTPLPIVDEGPSILSIILIVVAVVAVAGLAMWIIIRERRKKANSISITLPE